MGILDGIGSAVSGALSALFGGGGGGLLGGALSGVVKAALNAVCNWIVAGAESMLHEVVSVIGTVTKPSLSASWFSSTYWQVGALALLLTVPFLFAAAVQAILRTDLQLLLRAALVDLPIAVIAVYAAAPVITLLLAATDEMCSLVDGGGPVGGAFLTHLPNDLSKAGSGFLMVVVAVVILIAGLALLVELVIRSAAIYIVVLFLPLGFAAMVWPARRVWIKRMIETLTSLILSKFAMVAILTLATAALGSLTQHPTALTTALTAMALIVMATLSPWALLRLLPFTELAASATTSMQNDVRQRVHDAQAMARNGTGSGMSAAVDPVGAGLALLMKRRGGGDGTGESRGSDGDGPDLRPPREEAAGSSGVVSGNAVGDPREAWDPGPEPWSGETPIAGGAAPVASAGSGSSARPADGAASSGRSGGAGRGGGVTDPMRGRGGERGAAFEPWGPDTGVVPDVGPAIVGTGGPGTGSTGRLNGSRGRGAPITDAADERVPLGDEDPFWGGNDQINISRIGPGQTWLNPPESDGEERP